MEYFVKLDASTACVSYDEAEALAKKLAKLAPFGHITVICADTNDTSYTMYDGAIVH